MSEQLLPGTRVRFIEDNLCLINSKGTVGKGDEGEVIGPAPDSGWWYVVPDAYPQTVCPVVVSMIEVVA